MARASEALAEEYRAFRQGEAAVPLEGWAVFHLAGPDTAAFLQGLGSQDLPPGSSRRTYFLTEKGRPLALAWVRVSEDAASAWVVTDEGAKDTLLPHFEKFRIMEEVVFEDSSGKFAVLGVAGGSSEPVPEPAGESPVTRIDVEPLSLILAPRGQSTGVRTADPAVLEPWRISVGLPRTGVDFDLDRIATELDDPGAISFTKGCYVGQEVVARTSNRGQVRRRLVGFGFRGAGAPFPPKTVVKSSDTDAGFITSSALLPGTSEGVGLAYVSTEALSRDSDLLAVQGDMTILLTLTHQPYDPS